MSQVLGLSSVPTLLTNQDQMWHVQVDQTNSLRLHAKLFIVSPLGMKINKFGCNLPFNILWYHLAADTQFNTGARLQTLSYDTKTISICHRVHGKVIR